MVGLLKLPHKFNRILGWGIISLHPANKLWFISILQHGPRESLTASSYCEKSLRFIFQIVESMQPNHHAKNLNDLAGKQTQIYFNLQKHLTTCITMLWESLGSSVLICYMYNSPNFNTKFQLWHTYSLNCILLGSKQVSGFIVTSTEGLKQHVLQP